MVTCFLKIKEREKLMRRKEDTTNEEVHFKNRLLVNKIIVIKTCSK